MRKVSTNLVPNELPKESVLKALPDAFCAQRWERAVGRWRPPAQRLGAANKPCRQPHNGGVRCAHFPNWMHVSPTRLTRSNTTYDCLWAHPTFRVTELTIRYSQIPKGALTFEHGLSDTASLNNRQPVRVKLKWASGEAALKPVTTTAGGARPIKSKASSRCVLSAAQDGQRHHCLRGPSDERTAPTGCDRSDHV